MYSNMSKNELTMVVGLAFSLYHIGKYKESELVLSNYQEKNISLEFKQIIKNTIRILEKFEEKKRLIFKINIENKRRIQEDMDMLDNQKIKTMTDEIEKSITVITKDICDIAYDIFDKRQFYNKNKKTDEANDIYDTILVMQPNNSEALFGKGIICQELQNYDKAINWYDKILEQNKNDSDVLYNKAVIKSMLKNYQEAISLLRLSITNNPNNALEAVNNKGFENIREYSEFKIITQQGDNNPKKYS